MLFRTLRAAFRGTPVQHWRITGVIYRFYILFRSRSLIREGDLARVSYREHDFWIQHGDITMLPTLMTGQYEVEEIDAFLGALRPGQIVIDIGANIGLYSVLILDRVGPSGRLFSLEPNPKVASILRVNIEAAFPGAQNYEVLQVAAASATGSAAWFDTPFHATSRLAGSQDVRSSLCDPIEVRTQTLDSLMLNRIPKDTRLAMKIDVEGFEPDVLCGAREVIQVHHPVILFEICGRNSRAVGANWELAIDFLAQNYSRATVFGPALNSVIHLDLAKALHFILGDGRLHNVLLEPEAD